MFLVACSDTDNSPQGKGDGEALVSADITVAVLGGETSNAFVDGLRSVGVTDAQATDSADVAARAKLLNSAGAAIILVDATQGPLPNNREDTLLARQFCRGPVIIGFAKSALIDDPELLELEELEMRELLNTYDLPGDTAAVCYDSETARTKMPKGFQAIAGLLKEAHASAAAPKSESVLSADASVYALADIECFKRGIATPIGNGTYRLIFGDQVVEANIKVASAVQPASSGPVSLSFSDALTIPPDSRFVISIQEHVIAAGTVTQTKR